MSASGTSEGSPRSVAFNVQGFRVAVNKATGEIRILKSVHAADAGRVANPMQCRGQVEGGVAQSLGATLYEEMVIDDGGRVINPQFRNYHLPSFADIPRTEVFFADTTDSIGPMGAKSMSESPYNPVAAALGNAIANATGIRFTADAVQAGPAVAGAAREVRECSYSSSGAQRRMTPMPPSSAKQRFVPLRACESRSCHCAARSDEAASRVALAHGLLRFARNDEWIYPRPTVHSIWPCGSSVGRNTSLLLSSPNAERFIRMKWMFGQAMLISEISGTAASTASPIRYRLSCTLSL